MEFWPFLQTHLVYICIMLLTVRSKFFVTVFWNAKIKKEGSGGDFTLK
jgi:hypothetical protein